MTGRYGKTDTWDNVPALGGFVTAGFVFSTTDASLRDCSTGMDATDATTDPAPDPGGAGNPSDVPAASVPATTVQTKTPNATSTVLSTATLVSTAEAQPADPETVTVTVTETAQATSTSEPRMSCGYPCGRPTRPTVPTPQTTASGPRVSCGYPCVPDLSTVLPHSNAPVMTKQAPTRTTKKAPSPSEKPPSTTKRTAPPRQTCHSFAKQRSCAAAVAWAKQHVGTVSRDYDHRCDHVAGLAYSGSYSALSHWYTAPHGYRHSGGWAVPAGGLAFFGGSTHGHVVISIGGGKFGPNDINAAGRLSVATITQIEKRWGMRYLGWSQPWFKANH